MTSLESSDNILNDPKWIEFINMLADALVEVRLKETDKIRIDTDVRTNVTPDESLRD